MTADTTPFEDLQELLDRWRGWINDPHHADDAVAAACMYEQLADGFIQFTRTFVEMAAWCRLGAGLLRGEDVPDSIHIPDDEDPADTARWQKWRMS